MTFYSSFSCLNINVSIKVKISKYQKLSIFCCHPSLCVNHDFCGSHSKDHFQFKLVFYINKELGNFNNRRTKIAWVSCINFWQDDQSAWNTSTATCNLTKTQADGLKVFQLKSISILFWWSLEPRTLCHMIKQFIESSWPMA